MPVITNFCRSLTRPTFGAGALAVTLFVACVEEEPGLPASTSGGSAGTSADAGKPGKSGASGSGSGAGTSAGSDAGGTESTGGSSEGGAPSDGGAPVVVSGAAGEPEQPATGGSGGDGPDEVGVHIDPVCPFHSAAAPPQGGTGGAEPGTTPTVTLQVNAFIGGYLADAAGRTLYTYGADVAGDCNTPPVSGCTADCLVSWPPFDAGARVLPPELDDGNFGTIQRPDGGYQTTYMGWPLYYYKSDLTLGQMTGQGKGKIWHIAERVLPSITIMKAGALKYLADEAGRTLYVSADDAAATVDNDPVSNCSGACLQTFEGFHEKNWSIVTVLEPLDFSVFVRHGAGGLQLAYKGMPLYRAATDLKSGDMTGTAVTGFTAAVP